MLLVLILFAFGIRTSWFQTFLAQQVASYLSGELETEIRIDKVDIVFFDLVNIEGVYVEDKIKDTLLYSEKIHINIADFSLSESFVDIEEVALSNTSANLRIYKGDSTFNFQHIIDYFASDEVDTTESGPFKVGVRKVVLDNINFVYQDQNAEPEPFGLDYANIGIQNLSGEFSEFSFEGEELRATISDLHFKERSGLILAKLSGDVLYSPTLIAIDQLRLAFNNSILLSDKLALKTPNGSEDFSNFVHQVIFEGNVRDSKISMADIAYFSSSLYGMDANVNLNNVIIRGPVYGMKLSQTDLKLMDSTLVQGNFQIPNFDDPNGAFFEDKIDLFQTTVTDIQSLKLTPFLDGEDYIQLPSSMSSAGLITLTKGHFTGYLNDFAVDGTLKSGLGNVSSQYGLKFKKDPATEIYNYRCALDGASGKDIIVENLHLGALTGNDLLGPVTGYLSIGKGSKGLSLDEMDILFTGHFDEIELNDYTYHDINIRKGSFARNVFTGVIDVEDDNLALNYDGKVDLRGDMKFDFKVRIDSAKLVELNLLENDIVDILESNIEVKVSGTSLDKITGSVLVENLKYREGAIDFKLDSLFLSIDRNETGDSISLTSDYIDLKLSGKFDLADMWPVVQHQLSRVASNAIEDVDISNSKNEFFDLRINLKNVNPLMQFADTNLYVANNSRIYATYNRNDLKLVVDVNSDSVLYEDMHFTNIHLKTYFDSVRANIQYQVEGVKLSDSLGVRNAAIYSYVKDNKFSTNIGWDGYGDIEPALFAFNTTLAENADIITEFKPSFFFLKSEKWDINSSSKVVWNKELLEFSDFEITNNNHLVSVQGKVSQNPKDWLYFQVRDFNLADLNGILDGAITVGGTVNIDGGISDVYNNIRFMSLAEIKEFVLDGEEVGDLLINSKWNKENNSVSLGGNLKRGGKETFKFSGDYFTELDKDNLSVDLIFDYTDIGFLNAFSDPEMYTDIAGILNGKLKVTGELIDPEINGTLDVVTANVTVPMLNVSFGASGEIDFGPGEIVVDFMNIYDQEGNNAIASMQIYHYDWADWNYDITLDMESSLGSKRFLAMDTYYKDGDFYYGKAYVSGNVNVFGYGGITELTVNATTKAGTDLKLAMYGTGDLDESSFIVFDTIVPVYSVDDLNNDGTKIESSGLILKMNFNISKETRATIIFDPIFEDQIVVNSGEGNLTLNMDEYGEMDMYGKYTILNGAYYMNVKGLVSKDFILRNGSQLQWTKSPYDALINIDADYFTKASLEPILPPGIEDRSGDKEPIVATLQMRNTLMEPNISFKIAAPDADDIGKSAVKALAADQDMLNKQFFSILALNKFLAVNGGSSASGGAAYDIAENQINAILDNIGDNYTVAAQLDNGKTAVDFETQVGEKITIRTSLGVVSGNEESTGGLIGDVTVEYKLNDEGTSTLNAFNKSNQGTDAEKGPFTQGVGLHYEETFNTAIEFKLLQGFLNIFRKKENDVVVKSKNQNGSKVPVPKQKIDVGGDPKKEEKKN